MATEPIKNYVYEYRNINHVVDPLTVNSEDEWRESIREFYRQVDSGEHKQKPRFDSKKDLKSDAELNQMMKELLERQDGTANNSEIEALKAQVDKLTELVAAMAPKAGNDDAPPKEEPPPDAVTVTLKESDYEVVKADGNGWYDVIGPDGRAVTDKSMRKPDADKMAQDRNTA